MKIINVLKAKLFARKVELTAQAGIEMYMGIVQSVLDPLPKLAGDLAQIIVINQAEIERSLLLGRKMYSEVSLVLKAHAESIEAENANVKWLTDRFMTQFNELRDMVHPGSSYEQCPNCDQPVSMCECT